MAETRRAKAPDASSSSSSSTTTTTTHRPWDDLGPPTDPLPFPRPQLLRGRRDTVCVYDPETDQHEVVENVLFRDFARPEGQQHGGAETLTTRYAYWPNPYKEPIQTIMGHVEICRVLERCRRHNDDDDNDDTDDSSCEGMMDDEDDEIVFQWTNRNVAVKVNYADRMDRLRDRHAENPLQEISAMQLLGTDPVHVLGAQEVLFDGQNLNIVMRFCDNGDLFQLLQDRQNKPGHPTPGLSEGEARFWFRQLIMGVVFLHSKGICHRDLSPENVMVDGLEGLIIDLGMCLRVPYVDPQHVDRFTDVRGSGGRTPRCFFRPQGPCGKLPYMSPEIYSNRNPFDGAAADVWTSGTILFCMITGNRSYQRPHLSDPQFYWMSQGLRQLLNDWNVTMSETGIQLLEGMLQPNPRLRLTLEEVSQHAWFDEPDDPPDQAN